jgi:hypothetical protein
MTWDLGLQGVGTLALMSLAFGAFAQLLFWRRSMWWVGIAGAIAFFLVGAFISEVWFGWATEKDLQPNIDGLSLDETALGYVLLVPIVLVIRYLVRGRMTAAAGQPKSQ